MLNNFKISLIFVVNQYFLWLILRKRCRERSQNEIPEMEFQK